MYKVYPQVFSARPVGGPVRLVASTKSINRQFDMGRPPKDRKDRRKRHGNVIEMHASDFEAKTPEARERQLANLKQYAGKGKSKAASSTRWTMERLRKANIVEFATECLGISFADRPGQAVVLKCLYGLKLTYDEIRIYNKLTHQVENNVKVFEETLEKVEGVWAIGARGGKSTLASIIALYEATRGKWRQYLRRDEIGYVMLIATKQQQSEELIGANCRQLLQDSKISYLEAREYQTKSSLLLTNNVCIMSIPCNSTAGRGYPILCLMLDEVAFFRSEGPRADEIIYKALRPRMMQFPGAKCLKVSTPGAKQGLLWTEFDEGFEVPGRLTIQAPSGVLNPKADADNPGFTEKEYERDPEYAAREFGAQFAETVQGFFEDCIDKLLASFSLPDEDIPYSASNSYFAATDPSGLAGRDRFAFTIAHKDRSLNKTVVDAIRAWATKDIELILAEIKQLSVIYGFREVSIDRYAAGYVTAALEKKGIQVVIRPDLNVVYVNFRMLVRSQQLALPDNQGLKVGLTRTDCYYSKSNKPTIAHQRDKYGHADIADSTAAVVFEASKDMPVARLSPAQLAATREASKKRNTWDRLRIGLVRKNYV